MHIPPALFRKTLGSLPAGVTVVTTLLENKKAGVTISSFTALSLEPSLILFSLDMKSSLRPAFSRGKFFNVNILSEKQKDLAQLFASRTTRNWDDAPHAVDAHGIPQLHGALAVVQCRVKKKMREGDHDIIIGHVLSADVTDEQPLLYFRRHYHKLGSVKE